MLRNTKPDPTPITTELASTLAEIKSECYPYPISSGATSKAIKKITQLLESKNQPDDQKLLTEVQTCQQEVLETEDGTNLFLFRNQGFLFPISHFLSDSKSWPSVRIEDDRAIIDGNFNQENFAVKYNETIKSLSSSITKVIFKCQLSFVISEQQVQLKLPNIIENAYFCEKATELFLLIKLDKLEKLSIQGNLYQTSRENFKKKLIEAKLISQLNLINNNLVEHFGADSLLLVAKHVSKNLHTLKLCRNSLVTSIEHLYQHRNDQALPSFPNLSNVDLSSTDLDQCTPDALAYFFSWLPRSLTTINLSYNFLHLFTQEEFKNFLHHLPAHATLQLKTLHNIKDKSLPNTASFPEWYPKLLALSGREIVTNDARLSNELGPLQEMKNIRDYLQQSPGSEQLPDAVSDLTLGYLYEDVRFFSNKFFKNIGSIDNSLGRTRTP